MTDEIVANLTFDTAGVYLLNGSSFQGMPWGSGTRVRYIVSSDRVRLLLADGRSLTFETPDSPQGYPFAENNIMLITDSSGPLQQSFSVSKPVVNGVELTYTRHGGFGGFNTSPGETVSSTFVFGMPTTAMPTTGAASYSASVESSGIANGALYDLRDNSTATFSADFASGNILTALHLIGMAGGGPPTDFGIFNGTGTISGHAFGGNWDGITGEFQGSFFGPDAQEMGYGFYLDDGTISVIGRVAGRKD